MSTRQAWSFGISIALHLLVIGGLAWIASHPQWAAASPSAAASSAAMRAAQRKPLVVVSEAPPAPRPSPPADPTPEDLGIHMDEKSATLTFAGFTFDAAKVIDRAGSLFPFLTRTFSFEREPSRDARRSKDSLIDPFAKPRANAAKPPLDLSDAQLQALIDRTWSRRHRWQGFQAIASLTDGFDSNSGSLPKLLRAYVDQNALQPYADRGAHDPRLWAQLGLAADHMDFASFVTRYAEAHPSTRATTELLFLLDRQAEASLDTLVTLLDIDPRRDLVWTYSVNVEAHDALVSIRRYYLRLLSQRGLTTRAALNAHYAKARIEILRSVLRTTPDAYRINDARFLIGDIYWRAGMMKEAVDAWTDLRVEAGDRYVASSAQIIDVLRASGGKLSRHDVSRINIILEGERGKWISFSYDRLRQFGYRFDTF